MKLHTCLEEYFVDYLPMVKGVSPETIKTYKYALKLFIKFASKHLSKKIKEIELYDVTPELILSFLEYLERERKNQTITRNARLVTLKSLAKMIKFKYPEYHETAEMIQSIPQKRYGRKLIGYMDYEEILKIYDAVNLKKKEGFRDYTILHLLFDSGARADEVAKLEIDYFDSYKKTLMIKGKGGNYRRIELKRKTVELIERYIKIHRPKPHPLYINRLFINQRLKSFSRNGIYRICKKHLSKVLTAKQLHSLEPAHSFRHSCAINMLLSGKSLTEIKNHLGHENLKSTMVYLRLNVPRKKEVQKKFIEYTQSGISDDPKINQLLDWENKDKFLTWLDAL